MSLLDTLDVSTLTSPDQISETRAALLAEANDLITRAGNELSATDTETFERIERVVATLDARARIGAAGALPSAVLQAVGGTTERSLDERFTLGAIRFTDAQLRAVHEGYLNERPTSVVMELRDATAVPMALVPGQRLDPVPFGREPTRIASLFPAEAVSSAKVTFYTTTSAATAAAVVAEGGAKPSSNPVWDDTTVDVVKLAHITAASTEALADYSNLRTVIETEMVRGLINTENTQLLTSNGSGGSITGLLSTSGILTYAPGSAEARFLSLLHSITLLRKGSGFVEPTTVILHPDDFELIARTPATTGELIVTQDPTNPAVQRLWGMQLIVSAQMTSGIALVGDFASAARILVREAPTVRIDPYTLSANNMVRFIVEERLALAVGKPAALLKCSFNGTT